jgi:chromosome segregation ATPase
MGRAAFKLQEFEYLTATEDAVLLRIAGRWSREPRGCDLVVTTAEDRLTLEALPQAPSGDRIWRGAYSAPPEVLAPRVRFNLVTSDGRTVALPPPAERSVSRHRAAAPKNGQESAGLIARRITARRHARARRALGADISPLLERERAARAAAEHAAGEERTERERTAAELRDALRRAAGERARFLEWIEGNAEQRVRLERALSEQHERLERALTTERERAEQALAAERERAEQLVAEERERAEGDLESLRVELEQAVAEREEAVACAEERLLAIRTAGRRLARLQARIDDEVAGQTAEARASQQRALDEAAALRGRVGELEDTVAGLVAGVEDGERRLAQAEELTEQLRAAIAQAKRERPRTPDLGKIRDTLDRRLERLAYLERQAQALTAAIHERLATAGDGPGQEQLFEAPVGERDAVPV